MSEDEQVSTTEGLSCANCGVGHGPDDIFCENCGYDFITGSLPGPDEAATPPMAPDEESGAAGGDGGSPASAPLRSGEPPTPPRSHAVSTGAGAAAKLRFSVAADSEYFDAVVSEGELDFPDPVPPDQEIDLGGTELHIGRTSHSRAIHPDLDIAALTGDPAVSSRHAVIRVAEDGMITVTDVGSTNGTFVGAIDGEAISVGEPVTVDPGTAIYVGAWTRLVVSPVE